MTVLDNLPGLSLKQAACAAASRKPLQGSADCSSALTALSHNRRVRLCFSNQVAVVAVNHRQEKGQQPRPAAAGCDDPFLPWHEAAADPGASTAGTPHKLARLCAAAQSSCCYCRPPNTRQPWKTAAAAARVAAMFTAAAALPDKKLWSSLCLELLACLPA